MRGPARVPMIKVEICMRKAVPLYGHSADQVRAAQPRTSAVMVVLAYGWKRTLAGGVHILIHPRTKTEHHQVLFHTSCNVWSNIDRPKRTQNTMPAASEGT